MIYKIDNSDVNTRTDWRHAINPLPPVRMQNRFPGIAEEFQVVEPAMPPSIVVNGYLQATGVDTQTAITNLIAQTVQYMKMMGDQDLHSITIHAKVFNNCTLANFQQANIVEHEKLPDDAAEGITSAVRRAVVFTWRPLSWGGEA